MSMKSAEIKYFGFLHPCHGAFLSHIHRNRRLGVKTGEKREGPTGNPSPAPTHPHRTHDTTDQWRETRLVARPILEKCLAVPRPVRVQRPIGANHVVGTKSAPFSYTCHKSLRPWKGNGIPRLVSRYKNKGFVNS